MTESLPRALEIVETLLRDSRLAGRTDDEATNLRVELHEVVQLLIEAGACVHLAETFYAIIARYEHTTDDGYTGSVGIPTFYLAASVQGIIDEEGAVAVARRILTAGVRKMPVNDTFNITAVKL